MVCIRNKKGRFQRHSFNQETESKTGFRKLCKNCGLKVFQSHSERIRLKFYVEYLLRTTTQLLETARVFKQNKTYPTKNIKWRRYGAPI
jgi:hypothetical protein